MDPNDTTFESNINTGVGSLLHSFLTPAPALATSRYNRQLLIPDISLSGQERISSTRVLVIGIGGLGSPASLYLAGAGVHTLGLLDHDVVEESNLHRQIVHRETSLSQPSPGVQQQRQQQDNDNDNGNGKQVQPTVPMTKVQSALLGCRELNSSIQYRTHEVRLNGSNALDIVREYDIVLDCTDNPATRYLISDVCVVLSKVLVSGAAQKLDGQLMILNHCVPPIPTLAARSLSKRGGGDAAAQTTTKEDEKDLKKEKCGTNGLDAEHDLDVEQSQPKERGPCYRCVFPVPPPPEMVQGCNEIGILGPVVGTIGCLMATETLRLICKPDEIRKPTMLLYNAWSSDPRAMFRTIGLRGQRSDCVACGDEQMIQAKGKQKIVEADIQDGIMDYEEFCGLLMSEDATVLSTDERMNADEFLKHLTEEMNKIATVVDVREKIEVELGPKIANSISIPISKIMRSSPPATGLIDRGNDISNEKDVFDQILQHNHKLQKVVFVCQRGNDSQIAARKFIERGKAKGQSIPWIGDVKGGFIEIEKLARKL